MRHFRGLRPASAETTDVRPSVIPGHHSTRPGTAIHRSNSGCSAGRSAPSGAGRRGLVAEGVAHLHRQIDLPQDPAVPGGERRGGGVGEGDGLAADRNR